MGYSFPEKLERARRWYLAAQALGSENMCNVFASDLANLLENPSLAYFRALEAKHYWPECLCAEIVNDRAHHVSIPHARAIRVQQPIPANKLRTQDARIEHAMAARFEWEAFSHLLQQLGFWQRTGKASQTSLKKGRTALAPEYPDFVDALNLVNGGADIDYEGMFPECSDIFRRLERALYGTQEVYRRPSPLSVPALLLGVVLERLTLDLKGKKSPVREHFLQLSADVLDPLIKNERRADLYRELDELFSAHGLAEKQAEIFNVLLAVNAERNPRAEQLASERILRQADVLITLHGGDCFGAGYTARERMHALDLRAVVLPCGGQAPHDVKARGITPSRYSEAEEMMAALLSRYGVQDPLAHFPGAPHRPMDVAALSPFDTLFFEKDGTVDTRGNAKHLDRVLRTWREILGRNDPLSCVVFTVATHGPRALAEMAAAVDSRVAGFHVYPVASAIYPGMHKDRFRPGQILYLFTEAVKTAYLTGTVP